jgi:hypothetical protein
MTVHLALFELKLLIRKRITAFSVFGVPDDRQQVQALPVPGIVSWHTETRNDDGEGLSGDYSRCGRW